ncbi:MAG: VTT domain-containing protein [Methanobrevibacter sp.]|jgi:membrane protein DedA with SNARE-associated domain|nr:VTT domain-containing protein [Candidatus Methanoflexus mossambicus]
MLENLAQLLQSFFINYGSLGVFLGSIIEEIIAPIPSTLVILGSSMFMLAGQAININSVINLILNVSIPAAAGMTIGSLVIYGLCYYLGKNFIIKWGKYFTISWKSIENAQKKFEKQNKDSIMLFGVRAIPVIPSVVISAFFGILRYDVKKYIILTFLGGLVRASILGFVGWQFGKVYSEISNEISFLEDIVIIIIIVAIISYFIYKKKFKNKNK